MITPNIIPKKDNKIVLKKLRLSRRRKIDSGIKSVIDTHIITPAAKAREDITILLWSKFLIKIINVPTKVENPAIIVKRNEKE